MSEAKPQKVQLPKYSEKTLIVEIFPGLSEKSVIEGFPPGEYSLDVSIDEMVNRALTQAEADEAEIVSRIREELRKGGQIISTTRGGRARGAIRDYIIESRTPDGTDYLLLQLRVIRPQEGGDVYERRASKIEKLLSKYGE